MNLALRVLPSSPCLAMSTSNKHSGRGPLISFSRTANRARKVIQSSCPSYKEGKKSCPLDSINPIELLVCFFPVGISLTRTTCQNEHPVGDHVGTLLALPASSTIGLYHGRQITRASRLFCALCSSQNTHCHGLHSAWYHHLNVRSLRGGCCEIHLWLFTKEMNNRSPKSHGNMASSFII